MDFQLNEDQRAFAAHRGEQAAASQGRGANGIQRQRAADDEDQEGQDEDAAAGI